MFPTGLLWILICHPSAVEGGVFAGDAVCRDQSGAPVDWFIALSECNGRRYVYYDSKAMARDKEQGTRPHFQPLSNEYLIDGPNSPLVHTIGGCEPKRAKKSDSKHPWGYDNTMGLFWNDQPPNRAKHAPKKTVNSRDAGADETVPDKDAKDFYGASVSMDSAHSKGGLLAQVHMESKDSHHAMIHYAFLETSTPRFPYVDRDQWWPDAQNLFDNNMDEVHSKSQHFVCLSGQVRTTLNGDWSLPYDPSTVMDDIKQNSFYGILYSLMVSHVAITWHNYAEHHAAHRVWQR